MASVNKVILIGNLTADPELRYTGGGTAVTELRLATNRKFKKGDEWVEEVEYHRVVVWAKQAESCSTYLSKGRSVYIEGRLQTRKWQDKDGSTRYTTEVVAENVQFLGGGKGGSKGGQRQSENHGVDESEIPF